jgi:bifunctional non-homologous end joining protein LigD
VGAGLSQEEIDHLLSLLKPLVTAASPFTGGSLSFPGSTQVHWVRPELVCEVEYLEITTSGQLRHPLYRGLRPETAPAACRLPEK